MRIPAASPSLEHVDGMDHRGGRVSFVNVLGKGGIVAPSS
jgi:hypothetical protein